MTHLIDGKQISKEIKDELKLEVSRLKSEGKQVCLAVVQVGADPASSVYVNNKKKACAFRHRSRPPRLLHSPHR